METQLLIDPHSAFGSPISFASNPMLPTSNQSMLPMMEDSNQTLIPVMEQSNQTLLPMMEANNPTMLPVMEAGNQTLLPNPTLLPVIPSPIDLNCELSFAPVIPSSSSVNGEYIIPSMSDMNSGDQVPSSSLSPYEPDPDLTMCEVNSVDAFDCSVQQDLVDLSSVQPNLVDLSSTQENLVDLSSTQEDLVDLSSTQEDLVDLSSTQEDLVNLSSTQEELVNLSSTQEDLVDLSSTQEDLVDLSSAQEDFVSFSGLGVGQLSDGPMVTCAPVPSAGPGWPHPAHDTLSSVSSASGAFSPVETGLVPTLATHASGTFSPTESGLVAIPEDELLKDMEPVQPVMGPTVQIPPVIGPLGPAVQIPPMMVNNVQIPPVMGPLGPTNVQIPPMMGPTVQIPQIPDSNESDVASETNRTESASTAVSCSATLNSGYPQFERAEAMTAKQQVALWLTRTSTSDLQQEFSVPSLRSLVGPSKSSSHRWHKSRYRHMTGLISRTGSTPVKTIIKRNFSTKSLMERWSGSRDPIYCQEEPVMRKCRTTIALADIMGGSSHGHSHSHQAVPRRKKESRSTPQGSRRSLAFNRFSTEGIPFSNVGGCGLGTQRTAPGELYGLRHGQESPFPGIRPINRLRSQSTMTQCSRCNSVMSVHTPRTNSRATSQISLLLDRSRRRDQDEILCKICLMDYPSNLMVKLEDCGCTFCKECIQQYIIFEVMEGAYEISCPDPDCLKQGILNQHQMERLTSKDLMDKHRTFRLNTEVSIDAARTWCPSAGCDTICHICLGAKSQGVPVCCPTCTKEFCSLCSATWHPGITCSENGALLVKRGGGEMEPMVFDNCDGNIKRCPVCNVPIERDAGCAQMMCKRCKHVFCWYCLTSLDDDFLLRHYDSGACKGRLGHSRASVLWHRAQVIGIFAGFGILLLVASPLLLVMAPCIICCKCRACSKPEEASVEQATSDFSSKASIKST